MPNWGTSGDLSPQEIDLMANYLLNDPAAPPEFGMPEIKATWNLIVPVESAPKRNKTSSTSTISSQ